MTIFLALLVLPLVLVAGYIIAQSDLNSGKKAPSRTKPHFQRPSPQIGRGAETPAIVAADFPLREVYGQLNCLCGTCNKLLADCVCQFAQKMKDQIAQAKQERRTKREILDLMFQRYGSIALANKEDLIKRQTPPETARPVIQVEPPSHDFGTIPQEVVSHSFTVKNNGNETLVIAEVTTSCGCTTAEIDKKKISPGDEATLTVTFDPIVHDTMGKTTRTVFLETNDPKSPVKKIRIRAFVKKEAKAAEELPSFAYNSAQTLEGYRIATKIPHVLELMPCYCGCGPQSGHRHLKDCFVKPDGSFDNHGAGCNLCDQEAIDVKKWLDQGLPIQEIRSRIEKKYEKYGQPTKTPAI